MVHQLTETEIDGIRKILVPEGKAEHEAMKLTMVRLAHDGSDAALEILKQARATIPAALRGFFECAWDECSYFNFIAKVDEVALSPDALLDLLQSGQRDEAKLEEECRQLEEALAEKGVLVDLVQGVPLKVRLAYVSRLRETLGDLRYRGSGFVHFDGCTGSCDFCIQKDWCDVADAGQGAARASGQ